MTKARNISDLLDANGDVKSGALDNVPPSNDASALTTGTIDNARISLDANEIPNLDTAKITTGTFDDARMPSTVLNSNVDLTNLSATNLTSGIVPIARLGTSGTKDATTFLRGDNTFAEAGGGAWNLISTTTLSSDATVTVSGMDSTYKNYCMILNNLHPSNNSIHLQGRAIISGSPYTTGNYFSIVEHSRTGNANNEFDNNEGINYWTFTHDNEGMGNANSDSMNMIINIYNPSETSFEKMIQTQATYNHNIVNNMFSRSYSLNTIRSITSAFTGIQFFPSSGNLDTGTIKLYGIS